MPFNRVAFIGLGRIGFPVAGHLSNHIGEFIVHNRTSTKAEGWAQRHTGVVAKSPAEAASGAEVVFLCVGDDEDVRRVVLGSGGILEVVAPGTIVIDHTTTSAYLAQEMASVLATKDVVFMDAPVSGGTTGAEKGTLSVMLGGTEETFERVLPLLKYYSAKQALMGPVGSGQKTKMVNQILISSIVQGLAEGIHFGELVGLDMARVLEVLGGGAAQSWQLENRGPTMTARKFDFGFAVDLIRKDLGICMDEARRNGATLPVTALLAQFFSNLQRKGYGSSDFTSLLTLLD